MLNRMISKKTILNGGIILLICIALTLPVAALELNPISYFVKQPVPVQTLNKTIVRQAVDAPLVMVTALPRVTSSISPVNIPTMSQVNSGPGTCSQDSGPVTLSGTITGIQYTDVYDTTFTFMKLTGGGEVAVFPVDGGYRDRVYHLLETAYSKGNTIHIITSHGCSLTSFYRFDGITREYPAYKIVMIDLGPDHP